MGKEIVVRKNANELEKFFIVKNKGFNYNNKQSARCFFVLKKVKIKNPKNKTYNKPAKIPYE